MNSIKEEQAETQRKEQRDRLLDCLTSSRRRLILLRLGDRSTPTPEEELVDYIASAERAEPREGDSSSDRRAVHTELRHIHLPKLVDTGLVRWDKSAETVTVVEHPLIDSPHFQQLIQREDEGWGEVLACLTDERRRTALELLQSGSNSMTRDGLAREIAVREVDGEPSTEVLREVRAELHHQHLPKLGQAGLVDYTTPDEVVTYIGQPGLSKWPPEML